MEPPAKRPRLSPSVPFGDLQFAMGSDDTYELNSEMQMDSAFQLADQDLSFAVGYDHFGDLTSDIPYNASIQDPDYELYAKRAAAGDRFQASMARIFEKYSHDFEGAGDEIDLETGEVVINNGHLENMRYDGDVGLDIDPMEFLVDEDDEGILLDELSDEWDAAEAAGRRERGFWEEQPHSAEQDSNMRHQIFTQDMDVSQQNLPDQSIWALGGRLTDEWPGQPQSQPALENDDPNWPDQPGQLEADTDSYRRSGRVSKPITFMGKVSWTEALEIMQEPPVDEQATSPDEQYFSAQDELNDSGLDITVPADELSRLPVRYVEAEPSYALSDDESPVFIAQPAKVVNPMVQRRSRNPSPRGPEATVNVLKKRGPNKPRLNPEHTSRPPQTVSLENSTEQPTKRRPGRPRKKPVAQSTSLNTPEKEHSFLPSLPDGERDRTQVQAGRSATSSSPNQFQSVDIRQTQNSTWIPTSASSPRIAAQQSKSSKSVLSGSRMEIPDSEADTSTDINSSAPNLSAQLETTDSMELDVGISTIGEAGPSPDAEGEILFPHASPSNTSSRVIKDSQESSESTSSVANSVPTPRTNFSSRHKMRSQTHKSSPLKPQTKTPGKAQQQSVSSPIPPRSATRDTPQASRSTKIQRTKTSRSSRPSRFSILSLVGEDKDDDELLGAPGDAVSVARLFGSARKTTWKSSAMTTEVLRTPSKKQKYSTGLARESLSPGSIIVTPGGSKRQCGLDGFRCGRDFCFTCLS